MTAHKINSMEFRDISVIKISVDWNEGENFILNCRNMRCYKIVKFKPRGNHKMKI